MLAPQEVFHLTSHFHGKAQHELFTAFRIAKEALFAIISRKELPFVDIGDDIFSFSGAVCKVAPDRKGEIWVLGERWLALYEGVFALSIYFRGEEVGQAVPIFCKEVWREPFCRIWRECLVEEMDDFYALLYPPFVDASLNIVTRKKGRKGEEGVFAFIQDGKSLGG